MVKLIRMIRHRWWVAPAVGFACAIVAFAVTSFMTQRVQPEFEASAAVAPPTEESTAPNARNGATLEDQTAALAVAIDIAEAANSDAIEQGIGQISSDLRSGELRFNARGPDRESAAAAATAMRLAYVDATKNDAVQQREDRLAEIVVEAGNILTRIQGAQSVVAVAPTVPEAVLARHDLLISLKDALRAQVTNLEVDLVFAEAGDDRGGTPEEIQDEMDHIVEKLDEVRSELSVLTASYGLSDVRTTSADVADAPVSDPRSSSSAAGSEATPDNLSDVWTLDALETRYAELSTEYEALYLATDVVEFPPLNDPMVRDLSPNLGGAALNSLLGLLVGVLLGVGFIVGESALRSRIRDESDLYPVSMLAETPTTGALTQAYDSSGRLHARGSREKRLSARRATGIRNLRNFVIPFLDDASLRVVGVTGVSVSSYEVRALALELAERLGASDRRVIVMGLDFDRKWSDGTDDSDSVAALWRAIRRDPTEGLSRLKELVAVSPASDPIGVRTLVPGTMFGDLTDIAHTVAFRALLDACRDAADIVIVVTSDAADPATHSFLYGQDGVIIVCNTHVSSRKKVHSFVAAALSSGAATLGAVLLTGPMGSSLEGITSDTQQSFEFETENPVPAQDELNPLVPGKRGLRRSLPVVATTPPADSQEPDGLNGSSGLVAAGLFSAEAASDRNSDSPAQLLVAEGEPLSEQTDDLAAWPYALQASASPQGAATGRSASSGRGKNRADRPPSSGAGL